MQQSIWNDRFWLPPNVTWHQFEQLEQRNIAMPKINDLIIVYPIALLIYLTRSIFEYSIAQPIGRWLGIRDVQKSKIRVSPLAKFSESTWRFTFYLAIFLYGVVVLRNVKQKIGFFLHKNKKSFLFLFRRKFGSTIRVIVG